MENNWYKVISPDENISQGDILFNCPIFTPVYPTGDLSAEDFANIRQEDISTLVQRANVIVLNQACDLEVREGAIQPKIDTVLVGLLEEVRQNGTGKNKIVPIAKLEKSHLFLLEPSWQEPRMGYKIVHFDILRPLPWKLLNDFSKTYGPRLRLQSPYLEQMSQHFANHFGRIAIPENREDVLKKFFAAKDKYEEWRKVQRRAKMWEQLSEEEVFRFITSLEEK